MQYCNTFLPHSFCRSSFALLKISFTTDFCNNTVSSNESINAIILQWPCSCLHKSIKCSFSDLTIT